MTIVHRYDAGTVRSVRATPQGGKEAPAYLTRVGVFVYKRADGSTVRELRPASEVFDPASLESLRNAPVTVRHPPVMVKADNWKDYAVGHVSEAAAPDGIYVSAPLVIQDAAAVAQVDAGELRELSCGYTATMDPTPGIHNGEHYDQIQRNIRYNHVALLPINGGRAGNAVALRLDSEDGAQQTTDVETEKPMKAKIKIAGVEYEVDETVAQAFTQHAAAAEATAGRADALDAEVKKLKAVDVNALVSERVALISAVRAHAPEAKLDGLDSRGLMIVAITAHNAEFKADGKSDDYLRGAFEALPVKAKEDAADAARTDAAASAAGAARVAGVAAVAAGTLGHADAAEAAFNKAKAEASRAPLAAHRKQIQA